MPRVITMNTRNITSEVDTFLLASVVPGIFNDVLRQAIEVVCCLDVKTGNDPCHKELGQGEDIGQIDYTPNLHRHEVRCVAYQHGQSEVVDHEEDKGRNNEQLLGCHQVLELATMSDSVPVW